MCVCVCVSIRDRHFFFVVLFSKYGDVHRRRLAAEPRRLMNTLMRVQMGAVPLPSTIDGSVFHETRNKTRF